MAEKKSNPARQSGAEIRYGQVRRGWRFPLMPAAKMRWAIDGLEDKRRAGSEHGFTLLELMVVLGLLALLIGLVLPGLLKTYHREQERAKIRGFLTILRTARSEAVTRHQRVRLAVDLNTGQYSLEGFTGRGVLNDLRLEDPHLVWETMERRRGFIIFYPDGSSSGGRLVITNAEGRQFLVEVDSVTGKVSYKVAGK